jgi:transcriptional regulator with XRE-family HTH domain
MKRELTIDEKRRLHNIGHYLRTYRELSGYTQAELGHKANLNFRTIFRIEHGESITLQSLLSIADALELDIREVLFDTN